MEPPKQRIKLLHDSDHPDASGLIGDIIECSCEIAERFIDGGGAEFIERVTVSAKRPTLKRAKKQTDD